MWAQKIKEVICLYLGRAFLRKQEGEENFLNKPDLKKKNFEKNLQESVEGFPKMSMKKFQAEFMEAQDQKKTERKEAFLMWAQTYQKKSKR